MSTLRELIDKHRDQVPGLKVRRHNWERHEWFEIAGVLRHTALGFDERGEVWREPVEEDDDGCWELYQPPAKAKRKVMMYPALWKSDYKFGATTDFYPDSESAHKALCGSFIRLLTDRGVQVEVDE